MALGFRLAQVFVLNSLCLHFELFIFEQIIQAELEERTDSVLRSLKTSRAQSMVPVGTTFHNEPS